MALLEVKELRKIYSSRFARQHVEALKSVSFSIEKGEYVAIMGESGSGKTTLLNILGMLDKPTEGKVLLEGREISQLKDHQISAFRRENLGYVFQDFNLLDSFSVKDNILLPLVLAGKKVEEMEEALAPIIHELHIDDIVNKYPYEISGGQKQRTAIARALIVHPELILADEPTGSLDSNSGDELLRSFDRLNAKGQTILMVTHSAKAASFASRVLFIKDGKIFHQLYQGDKSRTQMYDEITKTLTLLAKGGEFHG